jgi:hypothetical protein
MEDRREQSSAPTQSTSRPFELNFQSISNPTKIAVASSLRALSVALPALDQLSDADTPMIQGVSAQFQLQFDEKDRSFIHEYAKASLWDLGFTHLMRGLRSSLEKAYVFRRILKSYPLGKKVETRVFRAGLAKFERAANKADFPELLEFVNRGLPKPISFQEEILTLQKLRNCLEHRGGVVGSKDVNPGSQKLELKFPRLRMFVREGDQEIDLKPGMQIKAATRIHYGIQVRSIEYSVGEIIVITAQDFVDFAQSCFIFVSETEHKITMLAKPDAPSSPF